MKKKIETQIQVLAKDLLERKDLKSTKEWKEVVSQLYDKLCVLEYLESQLDTHEETPKPHKLTSTKHTPHSVIITEEKKRKEPLADIEESKEELAINTSVEEVEIKLSETLASSFTEPEEALMEIEVDFELERDTEENESPIHSQKPEEEENTEIPVDKNLHEGLNFGIPESIQEESKLQPPKRKSEDLDKFASSYKTPVFDRKTSDKTVSLNETSPKKSKSLNDSINRGLHIGLNDRIAFINNLFSGSTQDFNRVLSQINTMSDFTSVESFLENQIKPDYNNWEGKEEYSERFAAIIEKKFS